MYAAVIEKPHQIEIREVPRPSIGADEALVQVAAAGICATDLHILKGEFLARYPIVAGHEFSGTIVELGAAVSDFQVGDRVACDPSIYCARCYYCGRNLQNHCENWQGIGITRWGAFAEYVAVPRQCLHKVSRVSLTEAAFAEPLACIVFGQERARPRLGDTVLIFGAGAIGLQHLQLIRHAGAASVVVVDRRPERLQLAGELGATLTVVADGGEEKVLREYAPRGFELVIDATGVASVVEQAVSYVQNSGQLLVFGVCSPSARISISPYEIYQRDLRIIGSFAIRKTFGQAVRLLEAGVVNVAPLLGRVVTLAELPQALQEMAAGKAPMKIQVHPTAGTTNNE